LDWSYTLAEAFSKCQNIPTWDTQKFQRWRVRVAILETDAIRQAITNPNALAVRKKKVLHVKKQKSFTVRQRKSKPCRNVEHCTDVDDDNWMGLARYEW
jgi:hypothetical protein